MKRSIFICLFISSIFTTIIVALFVTEMNKKTTSECTYKDGLYMVRSANNDWTTIPLPHTNPELTAPIIQTMEEGGVQFSESIIHEKETKRPLRRYDVSDYYKRKVKIIEWHKVENGKYCVKTISPHMVEFESPDDHAKWTVWEPDLFLEVSDIQKLK
jgi:hypothetical protein